VGWGFTGPWVLTVAARIYRQCSWETLGNITKQFLVQSGTCKERKNKNLGEHCVQESVGSREQNVFFCVTCRKRGHHYLRPTCVSTGRWSVDKTSNERKRRGGSKNHHYTHTDRHAQAREDFSLPGKNNWDDSGRQPRSRKKKAHHLL
jgi:hypothetical protein